jgi:hypothetical protein
MQHFPALLLVTASSTKPQVTYGYMTARIGTMLVKSLVPRALLASLEPQVQ